MIPLTCTAALWPFALTCCHCPMTHATSLTYHCILVSSIHTHTQIVTYCNFVLWCESLIWFYSFTVSPLACQATLDVFSWLEWIHECLQKEFACECTAKTSRCQQNHECGNCGKVFGNISHHCTWPKKIHTIEKPYKYQNIHALEQLFGYNDRGNTFTRASKFMQHQT